MNGGFQSGQGEVCPVGADIHAVFALEAGRGGHGVFHRPGPLRLLHIVGVGEHLAAELGQFGAVHLLRDAHGNEGGQLGEILVAAAFQQIGGQGHRLYAAGEHIGDIMVVNALHSLNAEFSIAVIPSPNVTEFN